MNPLQRTAAFLLMIGFEKARGIMALMDNDEIKSIAAEFSKVSDLSPSSQESIWSDFIQLGYEAEMNPAETLFVLRQVFNGRKICVNEQKNRG